MLSKLLAKQLSKPTSVVGQLVLAPLWNRRNAALNDFTFQFLNLQPRDLVLEVGFGGGYLLGRMLSIATQGFIAGVDVSAAMLNFCEKRYQSFIRSNKLVLKLAPAEQLPYATDFFTKVCSVNSIFYWSDAEFAIGEFWRVLRNEGSLVICFTSREYLATRNFSKHNLKLYEPDEVIELMKSVGFSQINVHPARDRYRTFYCIDGTKIELRENESG